MMRAEPTAWTYALSTVMTARLSRTRRVRRRVWGPGGDRVVPEDRGCGLPGGQSCTACPAGNPYRSRAPASPRPARRSLWGTGRMFAKYPSC